MIDAAVRDSEPVEVKIDGRMVFRIHFDPDPQAMLKAVGMVADRIDAIRVEDPQPPTLQ